MAMALRNTDHDQHLSTPLRMNRIIRLAFLGFRQYIKCVQQNWRVLRNLAPYLGSVLLKVKITCLPDSSLLETHVRRVEKHAPLHSALLQVRLLGFHTSRPSTWPLCHSTPLMLRISLLRWEAWGRSVFSWKVCSRYLYTQKSAQSIKRIAGQGKIFPTHICHVRWAPLTVPVLTNNLR